MSRTQEKEKGYNGWSNYETWNLALWLRNDEGSDSYWREATQEAWDAAQEEHASYNTPSEQARFDLAARLQSETEESMPDLGCSPWADLLGAAISEIDFFEIADNWLSDMEGYEVSK